MDQSIVTGNNPSTTTEMLLDVLRFSYAKITSRKCPTAGLPFTASSELVRSPVFRVVDDILKRTLSNLHGVQKNLLYWEAIFKGGSYSMSDAQIKQTIEDLTKISCCLATFLSQVYAEVNDFRKRSYSLYDKSESLAVLLLCINAHFIQLQENTEDICHTEPLSFEKLPDQNAGLVSNWTDGNFSNAIDLTNSNLNKLDAYVSVLVVKYCKPGKTSRQWMYYTFGAIGVSVFSIWLLRRSGVSGVVHNWVLEAKESVTGFFSEQLTLGNWHKELMELKQVQTVLNSRLEKKLNYPIQNLDGGEHARSMLPEIQKLQHDIETANGLLELNQQMLLASEINFVILAAVPAIFLSIGVLMVSHALIKQAQGKGRIARAQRIPLVTEVGERFTEFQNSWAATRHHKHGMLLYTLDRFYREVEGNAKKAGEWQRLREDIIALGKLNVSDSEKQRIISRMKEMYACLLLPYSGIACTLSWLR